MRGFWFTLVGLFVVAALATWAGLTWNDLHPASNHEASVMVYQKNARTPIFTAFLTVASLMLAMKTNILARLKEGYDGYDHLKTVLHLRKTKPGTEYYGFLRRIGQALAGCITMALVTSLLQMTLGFVNARWAAAIAIGAALTTMLTVVYLTVVMFGAHEAWFKKIAADKETDLKTRYTSEQRENDPSRPS